MTCIVGLKQDGVVYIGGDSAGVSGLDVTIRADTKVFINGPFLMGFTTSFRMGQLLHHALPTLQPPDNAMLERFMVTDFIDAVRNTLKNGGVTKIDNSVESGGTFIVGVHGRLFTIFDDFQVAESVKDYEAVGCGASYAKGSLYTTQALAIYKPYPRLRVRQALETAEEFSGGVVRPFTILSMGGKHEMESPST